MIVLLSAPVFGFLAHFLQNIWFFGGFSPAWKDLANSAVKRMASSSDAPAMSFSSWWNYVIAGNFSRVFMFDYLVIFMLFFTSYLLYQRISAKSKKDVGPLLRLIVILYVCGISWYIVFPSHSWAHAFVGFLARHLVPVASLGFAVFCYILSRYIKENLRIRLYANICLGLVIAVIVFKGIGNSGLPVTPPAIRNSQEFIKFKECLLKLRHISRPEDSIAVNYFRFPFIRYYTDRNCFVAFNKPSLDSLSIYPRYFIFMPYPDQNTQDLFVYLQQHYIPLWQCDSANFPAIFFELKN
jgi:hypothetical protein